MRRGSREWKRHQEWLASETQRDAETEAAKVLDLTKDKSEFHAMEGLREMLMAKEDLKDHLQSMQRLPVQVSVDRMGDKWVFVVRGIRPPISYWGDHEIWFPKGGSSMQTKKNWITN